MPNILDVSLSFLLQMNLNRSRKGTKPVHLFQSPFFLCESFHAAMTIMVIIITIRANHWSFQGENYPSVTCLSPGTAPKCPYYHHQGHSMCVSLCLNVCVRVSM